MFPMIRQFIGMLCIGFASSAHSTYIAHTFEFYLTPPEPPGQEAVFTGSFGGYNANGDSYLTRVELDYFEVTFNGTEQTPGIPAFTLDLADLDEFEFTAAKPLNVYPGALYANPGEPDLLRLTAGDGNSHIWFSIDAWGWGSSGESESSFGGGGSLGPGEIIPAPATAMLFSLAMAALLWVRRRKPSG